MAEYIDRKQAITEIIKTYEYEFPTASGAFDEFVTRILPNVLKGIPAADVAPVRHGKIIETIEDGHMKRTFSCCGTDFTQMTCWMTPKYCPNCGAKMDLEDAE